MIGPILLPLSWPPASSTRSWLSYFIDDFFDFMHSAAFRRFPLNALLHLGDGPRRIFTSFLLMLDCFSDRSLRPPISLISFCWFHATSPLRYFISLGLLAIRPRPRRLHASILLSYSKVALIDAIFISRRQYFDSQIFEPRLAMKMPSATTLEHFICLAGCDGALIT